MTRRITAIVVFLFFLATLVASAASIRSPYRRHLRRAHLRVSHWHPILAGSHDSLVRQNEEIDRLRLTRIADDQELEELEMRGDLVGIHESRALEIAPNLELNRRFCRPWTRDFLEDLSEAFYTQFHQPILVTSAVRTVEQQARLQRSNGNAAPIDGDTASSHLAGVSVDIGKRPMNRRERAWISEYVLRLQQLGLLEAAEERRQACFHIMVSGRYDEYRGSPNDYVAKRGELVPNQENLVQ